MKSRTLCALALLLTASVGSAQGFAYGIDSQLQLYRVDLSNSSSTFLSVVTAQGGLVEALATTPDGRLFATDVSGNFLQINPTTGSTNLLFNTGLGNIEGLDWDPAVGRMLASDFSATTTIHSIDILTFTTSVVKTSTSAAGVTRSLATTTSSKLETRIDASQGRQHATFDTGTGTVSLIGAPTLQILATDHGTNGTLYGLDSAGDLYAIDVSTGALVGVGTAVNGSFFLGMAADPVPEPATLLALAAGSALLLRRRRSHS